MNQVEIDHQDGQWSWAPEPRPPMSPEDQRRAVRLLILATAAIVVGAYFGHLLGTLAAIVIIAGVVLLHEGGHFVAAKLGGMKVTEAFIGFGPRLWSVRRGETEYGIKALPLGGYVRIPGMNNLERVDPGDEARTYRQQSFPRRLAVGVAGSAVHFALALIAAWTIFAFANQEKVVPTVSAVPPLSGGVSPAERAGFDPGDKIVSFDGHATNGKWTAVHNYIQSHMGKPITFVVERTRGGHSQLVTLVATPEDGATVLDKGQPVFPNHVGFIGIDTTFTNYSLLGSIPHAAHTFWSDGVIESFHSIGAIFSPHGLSSIGRQVVSPPGPVSASQNLDRPSSPIGVVQIANQLHGWQEKVTLFMVVNAFVGVLNLFPILPFDGGHVAIAIYERVRSRKGRRYIADANKMLPYAFAVVVVMGFLFISSIYLDITHPITLH